MAGRSKVRIPPAAQARQGSAGLTNNQIAVLLAEEAKSATGHVVQAFKRASRSAFLWPEEAADLLNANRSLTELDSVGPFLARRIAEWIEKPPELPPTPDLQREFLTMAEARRILAKSPQWRKDLRGDLQMHTNWSDGSGSVADMAEAAQAMGHEFIAITDHTKGLTIAGGINEKQLAAQGREIAKLNERLARQKTALTVLRSAEINLSTTGEVDMASEALAGLDVALGSFHSALRQKEDQTPRYLAALRNPDIQILGHPQGRVYNYRSGLSADWPRVFAEAARLDKAVEVDCYADRQDLKVSLLKIARKEGVRISLGTDSHHPWQLTFIDLGLAAACLAKIPKERILNFMPVDELRAWVAMVRAESTRSAARGSKATKRRA